MRFLKSNYLSRTGSLAFALATLLLTAGCDNPFPETENDYKPLASYDRYPIAVAKGPVKMDVSSQSGALNAQQKDTVIRFAQQAKENYASVIHVRRPTGGGRSVAVAGAVERILLTQGVPRSMIVQSTYDGSAKSPVMVAYVRTYAVTQECGNWDDDLAVTYNNSGYPNFGCAEQNNIAAMVANPQDLVTPRTETPSDPMRRSTVFDKYREGVPTNTVPPQQQQIAISTVATQ